jgi:hypothetical protein
MNDVLAIKIIVAQLAKKIPIGIGQRRYTEGVNQKL